MDDRIKTRVVGHIPPRYDGEPKSKREIVEPIEKLSLKSSFQSNKITNQSLYGKVAIPYDGEYAKSIC